MEDNKDTNVVTQEVEKVGQEVVQKTFTQEDLDNSFNAGVRKANSTWQKDEKYKEFMEWKKSNQNDGEKISELEATNNSLNNELKMLKAQIKLSESDVKKEFSKFVTSEILSKVDENNDFEKVLANYKKENPQYFGEVVVKKVQSSPNLSTGGNKPQTTNDIMNSLLRGSRNE